MVLEYLKLFVTFAKIGMFTIGGGYDIATLLIWQFGLSPIYIVLAGILGGLVYTLWLKEKIMNKEV